jgi:molecular chaperone DnaK
MKLGEAIYKSQAEQEAASEAPAEPEDAPSGAAKADDDVVDAEFEEVDDNKKA